MVESRASVVDCVPDYERNLHGDTLRDFNNCYPLPFVVRMQGDDKIAGCRAGIVGDSRFDLLDQGFGPFNL